MALSIDIISKTELFDIMDSVDGRKQELKAWLKCVKGNQARLCALTRITVIDGHSLNKECCKRLNMDELKILMNDCVQKILQGMKVNNKEGQWCVGTMGGRWFDVDPSKYGLSDIRVVFFSKKYTKNWDEDQPYCVQIIAEGGY